MCVDDVQAEIQKKKSEQKNSYCTYLTPSFDFDLDNRSKRGHVGYFEEKSYTAIEKDKIIEVLLSQERVLTLLYDKTFPPRANSQQPPQIGVDTNAVSHP